ncbi:hypothetical protein ACWD6I_32530, partial [Streptomyces sp. NPDC002454]
GEPVVAVLAEFGEERRHDTPATPAPAPWPILERSGSQNRPPGPVRRSRRTGQYGKEGTGSWQGYEQGYAERGPRW